MARVTAMVLRVTTRLIRLKSLPDGAGVCPFTFVASDSAQHQHLALGFLTGMLYPLIISVQLFAAQRVLALPRRCVYRCPLTMCVVCGARVHVSGVYVSVIATGRRQRPCLPELFPVSVLADVTSFVVRLVEL